MNRVLVGMATTAIAGILVYYIAQMVGFERNLETMFAAFFIGGAISSVLARWGGVVVAASRD